jgi:hypothetical protein
MGNMQSFNDADKKRKREYNPPVLCLESGTALWYNVLRF